MRPDGVCRLLRALMCRGFAWLAHRICEAAPAADRQAWMHAHAGELDLRNSPTLDFERGAFCRASLRGVDILSPTGDAERKRVMSRPGRVQS